MHTTQYTDLTELNKFIYILNKYIINNKKILHIYNVFRTCTLYTVEVRHNEHSKQGIAINKL